MELGYLKYYLKYKDSYESSIERQEKWRQKQINIFYRTGRPIFEEDYKKMLIRNNI